MYPQKIRPSDFRMSPRFGISNIPTINVDLSVNHTVPSVEFVLRYADVTNGVLYLTRACLAYAYDYVSLTSLTRA